MSSRWFDIVSGAAKGPAARAARGALAALSAGYAAATGLHRLIYSIGIAKPARAALPVISVGNIVAGGTGKTPLVEYLARGLASRGRRPAIVMRGYVTRRGCSSDEAALLRANLHGAADVIEDSDRLRGCERSRASGADVALLDDGFQHLRLARELDVVALDATNPFGFGRLLPAGCLRERPQALARAGAVVITRADLVPTEELAMLRERVRELAPGAPIAEAAHRPSVLAGLDGARREISALQGARVAAFCGIGNPYAFGMTLRRLGAEVVLARRWPDHHVYSPSELAEFAREARSRGAELCVTTQKDAVRLAPGVWPKDAPPLVVLSVEIAFISGERELWELVERAARTTGEAQ